MIVGVWFERVAAAGCAAVNAAGVAVEEVAAEAVVAITDGVLVGLGLGLAVGVCECDGVVTGTEAGTAACVGAGVVALWLVGDGWGRGWVQPCAYWLYSKFMPSSFMLQGSAL